MTLLITGVTGVLGSELKKLFPDSISPEHKDFDICDKNQVDILFQKEKFDLVIHTAAYTTVRGCEENKELAMKINVEGTKNLVNAILKFSPNTKFVYISTACVFDGHSEMYVESSIPYPENFYALTKLLGEYEAQRISNHVIVRTNFVGKKKWPYSGAFTDRFGTYLFADKVAYGIKELCENNLDGVIHIVGDKKISMFDLAKITTPDVKSITLSDYTGPPLTIDMSLNTERWKKYKLEGI